MNGYSRQSQRGMAILVITILLLFAATISTLMMGEVGVAEQKSAGADVRKKEVYAAAVGGLEYAVNWISENIQDSTWADTSGDNFAGNAGDTSTPAALANATAQSDSYSHAITYTLLTDLMPAGNEPIAIRVTSVATGVNDSHVSKTVSKDVMIFRRYLTNAPVGGDPSQFSAPPLAVEDCTADIKGNPDIHPGDNGVAMGKASARDPNEHATLDDCLNEGHLDLHGGSKVEYQPPDSLWNTIFGPDVTEADLRALEAAHPDRVLFVDSTYPHYAGQPSFNGNNWHASVGSADESVILYFDSSVGCPKLNGSPLIYGLVYYEIVDSDNDGTPDCTYQGWGGAEIHGSVAVEGDANHITANGEIYGADLDFGGGDDGSGENSIDFDCGLCLPTLSEVPGSWRDF